MKFDWKETCFTCKRLSEISCIENLKFEIIFLHSCMHQEQVGQNVHVPYVTNKYLISRFQYSATKTFGYVSDYRTI